MIYKTIISRISPKNKPDPSFPAVTAVIPAYNEEKTIVATVKSVLAANYKKLDVIVVDDGGNMTSIFII